MINTEPGNENIAIFLPGNENIAIFLKRWCAVHEKRLGKRNKGLNLLHALANLDSN